MRCVPNRTQLQLMFLHSLKQTWESVKGSSVFNGRLHHPTVRIRSQRQVLEWGSTEMGDFSSADSHSIPQSGTRRFS
jgi:hypothetical protein